MTPSAISGQQMPKKKNTEQVLLDFNSTSNAAEFSRVDVKTQLLGDKANAGRPTDGRLDACVSGRKCGRKSHDYSN